MTTALLLKQPFIFLRMTNITEFEAIWYLLSSALSSIMKNPRCWTCSRSGDFDFKEGISLIMVFLKAKRVNDDLMPI